MAYKITSDWSRTLANLVIDVLYCKINRELNISNEDCFPYLSVPPWIANMDDFPDFDLFYAIYLHNLNTGVNVIDLLEGYNEFGGSEVVADPDPEINNGIEIVSTSVAFLVPTTGTLIGESPARGNIEDIQHGNNGDCTGVIYNCMTYIPPACPQCPGNDLTDNELQGMMHGLMTFFSKPPLENIAISFAQRFFDKNSSDHYSTDLSEHVRNSTNMRNYMKLFGEQLNDKLKTNGGNIYLGAPIPMTVRPAFGGWHNRWHGLTILINDTEETTIWYIGNFNLDNDTKVWSGDFYFEVTDHFGLDKPDVIKFQGYHSGFAAWWALQHKKNYPPFKTKITIFATLKGQL